MKTTTILLVLLFIVTLSKSQTLKELSTLRLVVNINQADKFLSERGFVYDRAVVFKNNESISTTVFFKKQYVDIGFNAFVSLSKGKGDLIYSVGYNTNSLKKFNDLKKECELMPNCELGYEETKSNGNYDRYFLDGTTTYVFSIYPENENTTLFRYWVSIF